MSRSKFFTTAFLIGTLICGVGFWAVWSIKEVDGMMILLSAIAGLWFGMALRYIEVLSEQIVGLFKQWKG